MKISILICLSLASIASSLVDAMPVRDDFGLHQDEDALPILIDDTLSPFTNELMQQEKVGQKRKIHDIYDSPTSKRPSHAESTDASTPHEQSLNELLGVLKPSGSSFPHRHHSSLDLNSLQPYQPPAELTPTGPSVPLIDNPYLPGYLKHVNTVPTGFQSSPDAERSFQLDSNTPNAEPDMDELYETYLREHPDLEDYSDLADILSTNSEKETETHYGLGVNAGVGKHQRSPTTKPSVKNTATEQENLYDLFQRYMAMEGHRPTVNQVQAMYEAFQREPEPPIAHIMRGFDDFQD